MAAGGKLTTLSEWLDRHMTHAPQVLGERVRGYVAAASGSMPRALALASAANAALDEVGRQPEGRAAALDLLAADALVTLALLAQAEADPSQLREFATRLLQAEIARA